MARLFIDGFESGGLDLWDTINGGSASGTQKKTGSYAYYVTAALHYLIKNISSVSTIYFKFWFYPYSTPYAHPIISFYDDVGVQVTLRLNTNMTLTLLRGTISGTVLGTGTKVLSLNTWYLIEGKILINDTTGIAQLKIDGALPLDIDFSGDTQNQTGDTITKIYLGNVDVSYSGYNYFDDFVLDDAALVGDTRIQAISPTGAGNSTNWTPSAGNNWDCVEEIPASDANYLTTNSNDILDTYQASNLTGAVVSIRCVQVQARSVKEGASTPQNLKLAVRTGGSDYLSGDKAVPVSFKSLFNIWELNPNTSAAWMTSDVDGVEIGIKSAA